MTSVGMLSLATYLPRGLRSNAWWGPSRTESAWRGGRTGTARIRNVFDAAMHAYSDDPFFGSVERRVATLGETSVTMGVRAARQALAAAGIEASEVDALVSVSMFPDRVGAGDGGYLANELGTAGGAFNIEATCSGSLSALLTACALVRSGIKKRVLVVATSMLSRAIDADDVAARLCGDAAAAFVVGEVDEGYGLLGAHTLHTGETCGTWLMDTVEDPSGTTAGGRRIRLRVDPTITHVLRHTAEPYLIRASDGALRAAGASRDDVAAFVVNTPTAWHADFSARALGVTPDKVVDTFPHVANIGPALMPFNAHTAASRGRITTGDLVVLYTFGGQAEAGAAVFRWSTTALAPEPEPATVIDAGLPSPRAPTPPKQPRRHP
ncbi:3-oxoacyl-ACP synthase III family protein [Streptomyces sp. NPDC127068]|uniref:3-oxoacyl-ACP synthase III family protein n=1 Tax=Streptomyces sp. NPDC127068 TaxID=3347127 RepID=UPI00364700F9